MKQLDWRTFLIGLAFISSTVFATDVFYGDLGDDDLFFLSEVLIDGVELPEDLDASTGTSTVEVLGTGTLTVGDRTKGANSLNITVYGGTTIESERKWGTEDTKKWFEGLFPSPTTFSAPSNDDIIFDDEGRHPDSFVSVLSVYGMGLVNEKFTFSEPASFTFPAELPDGTKLWFAFKEDVTPAEDADHPTWTIEEGDFCVITNGLCKIDLEELNEVALVEEYFYKCPRSSSSDTDVINGKIGSPPKCMITCNSGYELNYETMKCVAKEGYIPPAPTEVPEMTKSPAKEDDGSLNPKFHRYIGSPRGRVLGDLEEEPVEERKDTGLIEYLMQVRNFFGAGSSANVVRSAEVETNSENGEEEVYSSAPLLPSTGPGIFLGLAVLGLGCMAVGAKGRRR